MAMPHVDPQYADASGDTTIPFYASDLDGSHEAIDPISIDVDALWRPRSVAPLGLFGVTGLLFLAGAIWAPSGPLTLIFLALMVVVAGVGGYLHHRDGQFRRDESA